MRHIQRITAVCAAWLIFSAFPLRGQYFGRNKVTYETFDFKIIQTKHFHVLYYPAETRAAEGGAEMLERWHERLQAIFAIPLSKNSPIILYANHADFQQTHVIQGLIPQGTGGVTEGMRNRVVIPLTGINEENNHVLGHELVHVFHYTLMKKQGGRMRRAQGVPTWFIEGMAEYLSIGRVSTLTSMWLRDAALYKEQMPGIDDLRDDPDYFPYRWGHAVWAYLAGKYGDEVVASLYNAVLDKEWDRAFESVTGLSPDSLSDGWRRTITSHYRAQVRGRTPPKTLGRPLITGQGKTNLAPKISPDGQSLAFLSRRNVFTMDLYLADARTGEVTGRLVSTQSDAHFDALRFIDASGDWSPDGRRFAFVVFENGDNGLAVVDVESKDIVLNKRFKNMTAIKNISWAPDGNRLMIFGTQGGIGDLYLYDLRTDELSPVTQDVFAEIHPDWSPDGRQVVFATDRSPATRPDRHVYGPMQLALMDMESGDIRRISLGSHIRHSCPNFSPDGESIYFLADADGFSDVYRYQIGCGRFERLTRVATGISGLTDLSPALSVAEETGELAFNVFYDAGYHIHALDPDTVAPYGTLPMNSDKARFAALPPEHLETEQRVTQYLQVASAGLPDPADFDTTDYTPSLKLLYVGQPAVGVAVDRFGIGIAGGISLLFGDLLNRRLLTVNAQVSGTLKDLGGQVTYLNQDSRINWGAAVGHIPYRTGTAFSRFDTVRVDTARVLARELSLVTQRVFSDRLLLMARYPFSTNRRFEAGASYNRISYDFEVERYTTTLSGYVLEHIREDIEAPDALNLVQPYAAYVGDYSRFGFTSPTLGSRYRYEIEPTFGSFRFYTVIADYRKYVFFNPVTFAVRAMHYGRYGEDAENERLTPYLLGYETWVRGYSLGSIDLAECTDTSDPDACPEVDRLFGSRVGVLNAELRVPLFGAEQFGLIDFSYLPTELAVFFDGGVAWTKHEKPELRFKRRSNKRIPIFSTGLAARFNILGYLVLQAYYAYPFQRPEKGAHFGFVLAPGW